MSGYSLLEVLLASTLFLMGVAGIYTGVGYVTHLGRDAIMREKATSLARTVVSNLRGQILPQTPFDYANANALLSDGVQFGNRSTELLCHGASYFPPCPADYPRGGGFFLNDLQRALGVGVGAISGTGPEDYELLYQGQWFRVHWNIVDDMPVQGQKTVSVIVTWRPYGGADPLSNAIRQGRYVQITFIKGRAL